MPIFRGDGGSGDSNTDATITVVTQQAIIATDKASEAAASASSASSSATAAGNSATAAAASATGVQAYATAAANSATAAASSATGAATSATNASTAQTNAETAETNAETAETNAETAETNAATSASTATTQASNASTSATSASNSASTASGYVTDAAAEVVLAAAQVTLATTQATNAATSATNASNSESAVATSATNAANSATAAASSASGASTSATNANNSAIAAAASAASIGTDPSFNSVTVTGTTAVKMSAGTTAQRPTGVAGQFRYNTTEGKFEGYSTEWGEIGGGGEAADFSLNAFTGNGSTVAYTLSTSPTEDNTLVYIDGVYQNKTGYAIVDNVLTFSAAPPNTSAIEITAATTAPVAASTEFKLSQFTGNGSTVAFTLSAQSPENNTNVYIDGVYQSKSNYSVSGTTLTFSTAPPNGSAVEVMAAHAVVVSVSTPDDGTVTTAKIVDANVTTAKIADANVTTAKIANDAVTADKIASEAIAVGISSVVTATSLTATVNTHVYVSAAGQTITLPASPTIGQRVLVTVGNFVNTVIGRNSSNIMSSGTDMTLDSAYLSIQFIYTDATQGWVMS